MPFFGWAAMGTDPLAVKQSEFNPTVIRILINLYYSDGVRQPRTQSIWPAAKATQGLYRPNLAGVINPDDLFKKNGHDSVAMGPHRATCGKEPMAGVQLRHALRSADGTHVWRSPQWHRLPGVVFPGPDGQVVQRSAPTPSPISKMTPTAQAGSDRMIRQGVALQRPAPWFRCLRRLHLRLGYELWARTK